MLWVVLVTTVVTILRFTITPTIAVVCFRWVLFCGSIVHTSFHSCGILRMGSPKNVSQGGAELLRDSDSKRL